jgi:hypothetical protein
MQNEEIHLRQSNLFVLDSAFIVLHCFLPERRGKANALVLGEQFIRRLCTIWD